MKRDTPLVSVIVPTYNVDLYIKKCLDSLQAQTLGDLEFLCIDDGSTDKESIDYLKEGMDSSEALEKASGQYGRFDDAVKKIDPRRQ